jgi:hypothetical protein
VNPNCIVLKCAIPKKPPSDTDSVRSGNLVRSSRAILRDCSFRSETLAFLWYRSARNDVVGNGIVSKPIELQPRVGIPIRKTQGKGSKTKVRECTAVGYEANHTFQDSGDPPADPWGGRRVHCELQGPAEGQRGCPRGKSSSELGPGRHDLFFFFHTGG